MEEKQIPQDEKLQLNVTVWSPLQTEMNRETMQYAQYIIFSSGAQDSYVYKVPNFSCTWDFPDGPVVKTLHFCRGAQFPFLVRELRFLHAMVRPEK